MYSYPQHSVKVSEWSASHSGRFTPGKEPQCPLNWGGGLRASLDILENRITVDPAKDHPVQGLLTYRLSCPSSNRSYIINICVNAEHHNRLQEMSMGSICDTSICDHFRFYAVLLPHSCVLCSVMWLDDYRGWIGKEVVIACVKGLGSVNTCFFF